MQPSITRWREGNTKQAIMELRCWADNSNLLAFTRHFLGIIGMSALAFSSLPAQSQAIIPADIFPNLVGIGIGFTPEFSGSKENSVGAAPGLRYQLSGHRFVEWWGPVADINLLDSPTWQAGPLISYRFGRSDVEDRVVKLLPEIEGTWEGGAFASYSYLNSSGIPWRIRLGVTSVTDLGNEYSGLSTTVFGSFWMPLSHTVFVGLGGGVVHGSTSFMQTYYGVSTTGSVLSGLPSYSPQSGIRNYFIWPAVIWKFDKNWAVGGMLFYQRLAGDAAGSPIVRERGTVHQLTGGVGIGYLWK